MEQKLDFIEREIQRLIFLIENLLKKFSNNNFENQVDIDDVERQLREEFDFSIYNLENISDDEFILKIKKLPYPQLDQFLVFMANLNDSTAKRNLKIEGLANKIMTLINFLDKNSAVYSFERAMVKNKLIL